MVEFSSFGKENSKAMNFSLEMKYVSVMLILVKT